MKNIVIVQEDDVMRFEKRVNELFSQGYSMRHFATATKMVLPGKRHTSNGIVLTAVMQVEKESEK